MTTEVLETCCDELAVRSDDYLLVVDYKIKVTPTITQ
jgi:hypothetical protein